MLYFSDSMLVGTLLQRLLLAVAGRQARPSMGRRMWVEDSDVKIGFFEPASPKTVGSNVKTSAILSIGSGTCEDFPSDWL